MIIFGKIYCAWASVMAGALAIHYFYVLFFAWPTCLNKDWALRIAFGAMVVLAAITSILFGLGVFKLFL